MSHSFAQCQMNQCYCNLDISVITNETSFGKDCFTNMETRHSNISNSTSKLVNQNIYESKENYLQKEMLFSPTDFEGH